MRPSNIIPHYHGGYSLVELIVTVGIFALAFVTISSIFLGYSTAQSKAVQAQRLLNEANYMFEALAREIRGNAVSYSCPGTDYTFQNNKVCLIGEDGGSIQIEYDGNQSPHIIKICKEAGATPCEDLADWKVLNPTFITVHSFTLQVMPDIAPTIYGGLGNDKIFQPMIRLKLDAEAGQGKSRQRYVLQTIVSSRVYTSYD